MEIVRSHVTKIPFKLYITYLFSDNEQIKPLGQLHTIYDKYNPYILYTAIGCKMTIGSSCHLKSCVSIASRYNCLQYSVQ